ncbi:type II 3-dehydroquinate dehydratase [Dysgonomonas sp. 521]|uniref:type II 3-dehydroquinate dehydratase n=1 Tax=Dysgonomonas sp. 521 TaxID=2302932 RepID=UPI0013D7E4B6|nr:type II 3-dehydroquinate dehydratase [Dysgonomonas sp. 521]NDV95696.1 type II 3-dehydroquinate dehydratase [Dysgonomonas sp. 521]
MKVLILNGPNLNLLGKREPEVYGNISFETYFAGLQKEYPDCELSYFQSNHEGAIIDKIHQTGFTYDGIVLNAGAYTHTSVAIHDAIKAVTTPVIEVHISNIHTREEFRHKSMIAAACKGSVVGLGLLSYNLAIDYFLKADKK